MYFPSRFHEHEAIYKIQQHNYQYNIADIKNKELTSKMQEWCEKNLGKKYVTFYNSWCAFWFCTESDYILFMLTWT